MAKKAIIVIGVTFLAVLGFSLLFGNKKAATPPLRKLSVEETRDKLNEFYSDLSGFGIPEKEVKFIKKNGGSATYGEITFDSAQELIDYLKITKDDVFYDLGSGVGKFCLHAYLATNVKKSCGIELSGTRYELAVKALNALGEEGLFDPSREITFLNEDIAKSDLSDATVIFMCATCYSDDLMNILAKKFVDEVGPGLRVISLREFKNQPRLKKVKTFKLPMTWSQGSPVHVYVVQPKK